MLKTYLPIILILISWFIGLGEIYGQQIFLFEKLRFNNEEIKGKKIEDHIAWLESKKNVTVSYSSLAIDPTKVVNIKDGIYSIEAVSYTHLDVYKRQSYEGRISCVDYRKKRCIVWRFLFGSNVSIYFLGQRQ